MVENLNYFDAHCHLNLKPLINIWQRIVFNLQEEKIGCVVVGADGFSSQKALEIAQNSPFVWASCGFHPSDTKSFDFDLLENLAQKEKIVAIGECGLDYFHNENKKEQRVFFERQISIALKNKKTLIVHSRPTKNSFDAYLDILDIFLSFKQEINKINIIFHFFSGSKEIAKKCLNLGFYLSFAGPITYGKDYDEVIKYLPIEFILSETDAPFAAPIPYRGQICYPFYVKEVVKKIALIKNKKIEEVKKILVQNSLKAFNLK